MVLTTHLKKNNNMQCYQGQKPVRETVIDVSSSFFFLLKFNAGKTQYFNFLLILPTSHNIHVVPFFSQNDGNCILLYPHTRRILNPRATHTTFTKG